jgi:hypothetical protein
MQQGKQPFWARLQLLGRLTLNAGKHTPNQPARLAHLDDGNDRAILVHGDEGPAQVVRLGHRGTPSVRSNDESCHVLAARPIESFSSALGRQWFRGFARVGGRSIVGAGYHPGESSGLGKPIELLRRLEKPLLTAE